MSQTFADQINGNPLYAARAVADEDGVSLKQYYAKVADLAAVAFSGSYNDLLNTPSIPTKTSDLTNDSGFITASDIPAIPTKTSDLTNDSGFITASDIPAQVNSDWNAASGVAQILNKPDLSVYALISSLATVATTGSYFDLSDLPTIANVPVVTSSDGGKVLTASYSGGTGSYSWEDAPRELPASTSVDAGKLLGVDASGDPEWQAAPTFTQEQADWNESDSSDPSYIKNKPTIPAAQVNSDWNSNSGVSQILNKPTLATVATSGSYNDLSNKPSIPTATSDLTNDSGFITLSDVPAQEQADWNETDTSDPAYIKNKPTIPSVPTTDQTYNAASTNPQSGTAVAGAIATVRQVPASTSSDENKVLTVDSLGVPNWAVAPSQATGLFEAVYGTTTYADIAQAVADKKIVYCRLAANSNSRMAFLAYVFVNASKFEFQYYRSNTNGNDSVFIYTVFDNNNWTTEERTVGIKTQTQSDWNTTNSSSASFIKNKPTIPTKTSQLTNNSGFITLSDVPAQVQADWDESDSTDPSYIQNKPTIPVVPTTDQTYDSSSANPQSGTAVAGALATIKQVPASTSADEGKVLKVDANGDPEWATGGGTQVQSDWSQSDSSAVDYIKNKPNLATVATSGNYNDLSNKPTIPAAGEPLWNYTAKSVSITGSGSSHRFVINDDEPKCYYTSSTGYTHDSNYTDINIRENANAMKHDWTFRFTSNLLHFITVNIYDSNNTLSSRYIMHGIGKGTDINIKPTGGSVSVLNGPNTSSYGNTVFVEKHGNVIHVYAS